VAALRQAILECSMPGVRMLVNADPVTAEE